MRKGNEPDYGGPIVIAVLRFTGGCVVGLMWWGMLAMVLSYERHGISYGWLARWDEWTGRHTAWLVCSVLWVGLLGLAWRVWNPPLPPMRRRGSDGVGGRRHGPMGRYEAPGAMQDVHRRRAARFAAGAIWGAMVAWVAPPGEGTSAVLVVTAMYALAHGALLAAAGEAIDRQRTGT